jgi:hypothetical protein
MADQSMREIERDIEHERAELRGTLDEIADRLTFEDMWNRAGSYLRSNGDLGEGFARVAREKPVALGLTALGIGLLLFGPSYNPARDRSPHRAGRGQRMPDRDYHEEARAYLETADFADRSASGPKGDAARSDPWSAPHHREDAGETPATGTAAAGAPPRSTTAPAASGPSKVAPTGQHAAGAGKMDKASPGASGAGASGSGRMDTGSSGTSGAGAAGTGRTDTASSGRSGVDPTGSAPARDRTTGAGGGSTVATGDRKT